MRRVSVGVVAATVLAIVVAAPASAGKLDQQQTDGMGSNAIIGFNCLTTECLRISHAQTFTAGITGRLDRANLLLQPVSGSPGPLTVEIRRVSGGCPASAALAAAMVSESRIPGGQSWVSVPFTSPAPVISGKRYAIVAYTGATAGSYGWGGVQQDPYAGGQHCFSRTAPPSTWTPNPPEDRAFQTFVLPVPATTCKGRPVTIAGSDGVDDLNGTPGRDVIAGLGGRDKITGLESRDLVCGGGGSDVLRGGKGKDKLYGQGGKDKLSGGGGKDRCVGGKKEDSAKKCENEKSI